MYRSLRGACILMLVTAFSASPWAAEGAQICSAGQTRPLGAAFVALAESVGVAMGTPIECAHTDRETGNEFQQTTTGVAVYQHGQAAATFTNGYDFWRLGPDGLTQWHGWHGRAGPTAPADTEDVSDIELTLDSIADYPKALAGRVVEAQEGGHPRMVLEHDGKIVGVEVGEGCLRGQALLSPTLFVISKDTFAEPGSRLVLEIGGRECTITASQPL
jgi:hypothetical protein